MTSIRVKEGGSIARLLKAQISSLSKILPITMPGRSSTQGRFRRSTLFMRKCGRIVCRLKCTPSSETTTSSFPMGLRIQKSRISTRLQPGSSMTRTVSSRYSFSSNRQSKTQNTCNSNISATSTRQNKNFWGLTSNTPTLPKPKFYFLPPSS